MSSKRFLADLPPSVPWAIAGIAAALALEQFTGLDLWLQDRLFTPGHGWLIDPGAPLPRFFLYRLPKMLLWLFGLGVLVLAAGREAWRQKWGLVRRDLWVLFTTLALVPLSVGAIKSVSHVPCPCELERYGGAYAYVKIFSPYAPEERPERPGRCFPAAQASGGFALMGLLAIGGAAGRYRRGFLAGSAAGWFLGLYQMARGAHFLSHTLTAWLWAWLLAVLLDHYWPRAVAAAAPAAAAAAGSEKRRGLLVRIGGRPAEPGP